MSHQDPDYPIKYTERIRQLIPDYDGMKRELVGRVHSLRRVDQALRILELGAGGGEITAELLRDPQINVVTVDYSEAVCDFLRRELRTMDTRFEVIHGDVNEDATWTRIARHQPFDAILATFIIHDIYTLGDVEVSKFLHRCSEALRSDGLFLYADPIRMGRGVTTALVAEWQQMLPFDTESLERFQSEDPLFFKPRALADIIGVISGESLTRCDVPWLSMHFALVIFRKGDSTAESGAAGP